MTVLLTVIQTVFRFCLFSGPESNGSYVVFGCHVTVSSSLGQFLSLSLSFVTLTLPKSNSYIAECCLI